MPYVRRLRCEWEPALSRVGPRQWRALGCFPSPRVRYLPSSASMPSDTSVPYHLPPGARHSAAGFFPCDLHLSTRDARPRRHSESCSTNRPPHRGQDPPDAAPHRQRHGLSRPAGPSAPPWQGARPVGKGCSRGSSESWHSVVYCPNPASRTTHGVSAIIAVRSEWGP